MQIIEEQEVISSFLLLQKLYTLYISPCLKFFHKILYFDLVFGRIFCRDRIYINSIETTNGELNGAL